MKNGGLDAETITPIPAEINNPMGVVTSQEGEKENFSTSKSVSDESTNNNAVIGVLPVNTSGSPPLVNDIKSKLALSRMRAADKRVIELNKDKPEFIFAVEHDDFADEEANEGLNDQVSVLSQAKQKSTQKKKPRTPKTKSTVPNTSTEPGNSASTSVSVEQNNQMMLQIMEELRKVKEQLQSKLEQYRVNAVTGRDALKPVSVQESDIHQTIINKSPVIDNINNQTIREVRNVNSPSATTVYAPAVGRLLEPNNEAGAGAKESDFEEFEQPNQFEGLDMASLSNADFQMQLNKFLSNIRIGAEEQRREMQRSNSPPVAQGGGQTQIGLQQQRGCCCGTKHQGPCTPASH